jgi:predicted nuclease of predicted toxin-antitoxin system
MRILLDENIPFGMRKLLGEHDVKHASEEGWDGISNGELIAYAEAYGYDVMVTADKNLRYQQNIADRKLAIMALSTNHWKTIRRGAHFVVEALDHVIRGAFVEVDFNRPLGRPRDPGPRRDR